MCGWINFLFVCLLASLVASQSISWSPCALFTNGESGGSAECGTFNTVGNYNTGEGQVEIFIKRIVGQNAGGNILWMIADGPGLSGAMFEPIALQLQTALGSRYSIYLMDHRGTGQSNPNLHCPLQPGEIEESPEGDCIQFLEDTFGDTLEYFNTQFIARDYILITDEITGSDDSVLLYGAGYGGFIINQIIIQNPELADAVVLDSLLLPSIADSDINAQDTGLDLVDRCTNFGDCRAEIERRDPEELVENIFRSFGDLDCPGQLGINFAELQIIFRNMASDQEYRALLLPVTVRLLRCNSEDLVYLRNGIDNFKEFFYEDNLLRNASSSIVEGQSYVLRNHIGITELLRKERGFQPSSQELLATSEQLYFSNYFPTFISEISRNWNWESPDDFDSFDFAVSDVPMLILSGEFDMMVSSRYSARAADHYDNEFQWFLEIPFGGHITLYNTPTVSGVNCGFELIAEFFNQGPGNWNARTISTECIPRLVPIDFAAERARTIELSVRTFGSEDPWGSGLIPGNGDRISGSLSSNYVDFPFSTNNLPPIPEITLSRIIVFDSYDSSNPKTFRGTLSYLSTGILPPSLFFSPDGAVVGSSSALFVNFSLFVCLLILGFF